MTVLLVDDLAQFIRRVDGDNNLSADDLGRLFALFMEDHTDGFRFDGNCQHCVRLFTDFIERTNPDKRMCAGHLAELIVAEFKLDVEG